MFVPLFFCDGTRSSVYQGRRTQANRAGQPKELVVLLKLTIMVIYQKLEPDRRGVEEVQAGLDHEFVFCLRCSTIAQSSRSPRNRKLLSTYFS
jgi:hypothetical protein